MRNFRYWPAQSSFRSTPFRFAFRVSRPHLREALQRIFQPHFFNTYLPSMAHYSSTTAELSQHERGPTSCDSQHSPRRSLLSISYQRLSKAWPLLPLGNGSSSTRTRTRTCIHILDNDSFLNIFHFCRPAVPSFLGENEVDIIKILGGDWNDGYSVVKVCRRWRYLVLESASLLGLSILCT